MKDRNRLWRLLATLVVLALTALIVLTKSPSLGIDLRGGSQIVLETQDTDRVKADDEATERAVSVLSGRIDALGVAETTIVKSGSNRIIIELPDVQDPSEAAEVVGQTATLEFREVLSAATEETKPEEGQAVVEDESGQPLLLGPAVLDGNGISDAAAGIQENSFNTWVVSVDFNGEGRGPWGDLVQSACANPAMDQRIAIVLDNTIISSPGIQPDLCQSGGGSSTQITGNFTQESAEDLAVLIKGGALPVPVEIINQSTIGPTLGKAAIDASIAASVVGLIITGLYIIFVYRIVGVMATIALACYALIAYAMTIQVGATLTLPGLAGFVLAIGLAIDANVLVFERAREEWNENPAAGLEPALRTGFNKAWSAIIDSNITTILAAMLLFFLASGPVKGFGITLTIGVIASMFSALVLARVLSEWVIRIGFIRKHPKISGLAGTGKIRTYLNTSAPFIMKRAGTWIVVTLIIAVVSVAGVAKGMNLGVEFTGGKIIEYTTEKTVDPEDVRVAVAEAGFPTAVVQSSSSDGQNENISVRLGDVSDTEAEKIRGAVSSVAGETKQLRAETINPSLGKELRNKALIAFTIAIGAQMIYLAWRFRWTWSLAAILSMVSVVLFVVGVFAWWNKPIDGVFLAAVLSVIGLVVNDTIVVFDRIREHAGLNRTRNLRTVVNEAVMQTIPRTVNTGISAIAILGALAVFGGDSLRDFSIALLIGFTAGMVSTIFTASAIAVWLEERWPYDPQKDQRKYADPYANIDDGRNSGAVI